MKLISSAVVAALTLSLAPSVFAFPALAKLDAHRIAELENMARNYQMPSPSELKERGTKIGKVTYGRKKLPDADHPFKAPGKTDVRGVCPGNNIMANYGYIDRSGITNFQELVYGQQEMLGFTPGLAVLLATIAMVINGNPIANKVSIGGPDKRVPNLLIKGLLGSKDGVPGGLNAPGKYEIDHSLTRNDAYFGDHVSFNGTLYEEMFKVADRVNNGVISPQTQAVYRNERYKESVATNPEFTFPTLGVLFFGADQFVWRSQVTADAKGDPVPATRKSAADFYGAKDEGNGRWSYVPERLTDDWYRPAKALSIAEVVQHGLVGLTYAATHGPALPIGFTPNSIKSEAAFACALRKVATGLVPASILGIDLVQDMMDKLGDAFDEWNCA